MKTDMSMYGADESIPLEFKVGDTLSPQGRDVVVSAIHKDRVVLSLVPSAVTITQEPDPAAIRAAVEAEREICAEIADEHERTCETEDDVTCRGSNCAMLIAAAIRARKGRHA